MWQQKQDNRFELDKAKCKSEINYMQQKILCSLSLIWRQSSVLFAWAFIQAFHAVCFHEQVIWHEPSHSYAYMYYIVPIID